MGKQITAVDYHALATERGFKWLGPEVPTTVAKTWWQCPQVHQWNASYHMIQRGKGCPYCAGNTRKVAVDYHALATERGFKWLGPEQSNVRSKTRWECGQGHVWEAPYVSLCHEKTGCPYCSGLVPKTQADYLALAAEWGYQWLGPEVPNVREKTWWLCKEGHHWETTYNHIQQGRNCPHCSKIMKNQNVSSQQIAIGEMLGGEINHYVDGYYIDIAINWQGFNVAIEYDGWYWHRGKEAEDKRRDIVLMLCGWRVLRIKSGEQLPGWQTLVIALDHLVQSPSMYAEIVLDDWKGYREVKQ